MREKKRKFYRQPRTSKYMEGIGIGGFHCPCCFPGPGKERKKLFKQMHRKERKDAFKIEMQCN